MIGYFTVATREGEGDAAKDVEDESTIGDDGQVTGATEAVPAICPYQKMAYLVSVRIQ